MDSFTKRQLRRTRAARKTLVNTCPASRHLHMIAEHLAKGLPYPMLQEEPEHCAGTMLSVLESLWKLRTETKWPSPKEAARQGRAIRKAMDKAFGTKRNRL